MRRCLAALVLLHSIGLSSCEQSGGLPNGSALEELADLSDCAGPEGVDDCAPARFERTFAHRLPAMRAHRDQLVPIWLERLERGEHAPAYALAWAGARDALPVLRRALLEDRHFYGWETRTPCAIEGRMSDDNHPHQVARILAIEHLSGTGVARAVALTPAERAALVREAYQPGEPGQASDVARWLLLRLAPEALALHPPAAAPEARSVPVPAELEGHVVVSHDSLGHHDVFTIARARGGLLEAVEAREGCRVLSAATVRLGLPARSLALPRALFSNEANICLSEPEGLAPGSSLGALGIEPSGRPAELDASIRASVEALALEALAHVADPVDFAARASATSIEDRDRTWVAVDARAMRRPRALDWWGDGRLEPVPCATRLCEVEQHEGPRASLVAIYELGPDGLAERLLVPSRPGGCSEAEHDDVSLAGGFVVPGGAPLFAIERRFCDGWVVELYSLAGGAARLVAARGGSAI